jgi:uncharacterized protein YraI
MSRPRLHMARLASLVHGPLTGRAGRRAGGMVIAASVAVLVAVSVAGSAAAEPATTASYAAGATATRYSGLAFDTCTAPSLAAVTAWGASPYRAIGVYIGGVNRTCAQPQLTASWVTAVSQLKWRLLPVYKGLQAPCGGKPTDQKITPTVAASQGSAAADDAVADARALGMLGGSALYNDMETYSTGDTACRTAVLRYLSGWTKEVHKLGYVAGVYAQLSSGATDLSGVYASASYARPDVLWVARYDGDSSLTGWAGVPDSHWAVHQRAKQYRNSHDETYGGVTINIDNDRVDALAATVGHSYQVTSSGPLSARSGPSRSYPVTGTFAAGSALTVACQARGTVVGTTSVWDKLPGGSYVSDHYVSTPSGTGYSAPLPRCSYPYQVAAAGGLAERSGPGRSHPAVGRLPNGALAPLICQRAGSRVGTTSVWDKLTDGHWVSDYYVATPSKTTYSKPAPRC